MHCVNAGLGAVTAIRLGDPNTAAQVATAAALAGGRLYSAVAFVSTLLGNAEEALLTAYAAAAPWTSRYIVASSISEAAHHDEAATLYGPACYSDWAARLRHRLASLALGSPVPDITIKFAALTLILISDTAFVLPAAGAAPSAALAGGSALGFSGEVAAGNSDDEDEVPVHPSHRQIKGGAASDAATGVAVLAHALAQAAAVLGVRPEAFCLGPAAKAVGERQPRIPT